ncbi:Hypothetical predicted protein [Mytilus galloprovincialis]|uniref:Uncharacterized protein n=1 Tax=Mytilus galloprovincialis TaxID=29158 RepID=A0A8B6HN08_MYTGA|nr:Hypothetical predicted protein [Mytilus galloprovincialis]
MLGYQVFVVPANNVKLSGLCLTSQECKVIWSLSFQPRMQSYLIFVLSAKNVKLSGLCCTSSLKCKVSDLCLTSQECKVICLKPSLFLPSSQECKSLSVLSSLPAKNVKLSVFVTVKKCKVIWSFSYQPRIAPPFVSRSITPPLSEIIAPEIPSYADALKKSAKNGKPNTNKNKVTGGDGDVKMFEEPENWG